MKFYVSHKVAVFFTGITALLFMTSETKNSHTTRLVSDNEYVPQVNRYSSVPNYGLFTLPPDDTSIQFPAVSAQNPGSIWPNKNNNVKCDTLKSSYKIRVLAKIFTPEIISHVDPTHYLFYKVLLMPSVDFAMIKFELHEVLNDEQLPPCYIPYAKALSSLIRCWYFFQEATRLIQEIQKDGSLNQAGFSSLPSNISSFHELLQLFSPDIFSDPQPPRRLFDKLLDLPNDTVQNIRVQLQNSINEWTRSRVLLFPQWYTRYGNRLYRIIRNGSGFDEMKRDMDKIQRISTFEKRFSES